MIFDDIVPVFTKQIKYYLLTLWQHVRNDEKAEAPRGEYFLSPKLIREDTESLDIRRSTVILRRSSMQAEVFTGRWYEAGFQMPLAHLITNDWLLERPWWCERFRQMRWQIWMVDNSYFDGRKNIEGNSKNWCDETGSTINAAIRRSARMGWLSSWAKLKNQAQNLDNCMSLFESLWRKRRRKKPTSS